MFLCLPLLVFYLKGSTFAVSTLNKKDNEISKEDNNNESDR